MIIAKRFSAWPCLMVVGICLLCGYCAATDGAKQAKVVGNGVVLDASTSAGIDGVTVHLYEADEKGRLTRHVNSAVTNSKGVYEIEFEANLPRLKLYARKGTKQSQNIYGPASLFPIRGSGGKLVDVPLDLRGVTPEMLGAIMDAIHAEKLIPMLNDRDWAVEAVAAACRTDDWSWDDSEFHALVDNFQPPIANVVVGRESVVVAKEKWLSIHQWPSQLDKSAWLEVGGSKVSNVIDVGLGREGIYAFVSDPLERGLVVNSVGGDGRLLRLYDLRWGDLGDYSRSITTAGGGALKGILLVTEDGDVRMVADSRPDSTDKIWLVTSTPFNLYDRISRPAVSGNGRRCAIVSLDGRIFAFESREGPFAKDVPVRRLTMQSDKRFANGIALSPDGVRGCIGVGFGEKECGIVEFPSIFSEGSPQRYFQTAFPIMAVEYLEGEVILAQSLDRKLHIIDSGSELKRRRTLTGVGSFGISEDRTRIALLPSKAPSAAESEANRLVGLPIKVLLEGFDGRDFGIGIEE